MVQITLYNLIHGPEIWLGIAGLSLLAGLFLAIFFIIWALSKRFKSKEDDAK